MLSYKETSFTPPPVVLDPESTLTPNRKTDISLPKIKFVDWRDGFQGGDLVINSVKEAVTILMLVAPFAEAYNGDKEFELGFPGSSQLINQIIQASMEYLKAMGIEDAGNTFARTLRKGPETGVIINPLDDQSLTDAISLTRASGIHSMTFVSKGTPEQAQKGLGLEDPMDHISMVFRAFDLARQNGITDLTLDPEHSFDALISDDSENQTFFIHMVLAAYAGGCRNIVLCDTNGNHTPKEIVEGLVWLHEGALESLKNDPETHKKWKEMLDNCRVGLHLHDDQKAALRSTMDALDTDLLGHLDMTFFESGERGGGNNVFATWAANMYQERGIDVFDGNEQIWKLMATTVHRVNFLMHRNHLSPRMHFFGMLAAAQTAGMHTNTQTKGKGEDGKTSNLYRPDAYSRNNSVLDKLGMDETFSLTWMAGRFNIAENMEKMGLGKYIHEKGQACYDILSDHVTGDVGVMCYTKNLASAALRMYEECTGNATDDLIDIGETRVEATVRDGHSWAEARIYFGNGDGRKYFDGATSEAGILDAQFRVLRKFLHEETEKYPEEFESMEIVDYSQHNIGTGVSSKVVTQIVFRDKKTKQTWSNVVVRGSSFNSAYECMKEGMRYNILVNRGELNHIQDPHLERMYRLDTDELIRELHTAVGWDGDVALELLDRIESDEEKN